MSALEIILIIVLGVVVLLGVIGIVGWTYYKRLMRVMAAQFVLYNRYAEKGGIVFLGDSLTDFYPLGEFFPKAATYNRGIAGNTSLQVIERLADVVAIEPKTVFLQIGINDILRLSGKVASPENLTARIMQIADTFPNAHVYILSLYPINRKRSIVSKLICFRASNARVRAVNDVLRRRCEEKGYTYIDMYPHLTDEKGNLKKAYTIEGLHLTADGYAVITDVLRPYMDKEIAIVENR